MTTFHISAEMFKAILAKRFNVINVSDCPDTHAGDRARLCCDEMQQALQITVADITRGFRSGMMNIVINDDIEPIDYFICA